jgi:Di-N-acetylchitobiase
LLRDSERTPLVVFRGKADPSLLHTGSLLLLLSAVAGATAACPCADKTLCSPLRAPAVADREVLAFNPSQEREEWEAMDWEQLTTIASFTWPVSDELYCHAHSHGVRIVKCVDFDATQITNATARSQWVAGILNDTVVRGTDGVNVDIEGSNPHP